MIATASLTADLGALHMDEAWKVRRLPVPLPLPVPTPTFILVQRAAMLGVGVGVWAWVGVGVGFTADLGALHMDEAWKVREG